MSHEHVGECCSHDHHHETERQVHIQHIALHVGDLCCKGLCGHEEHIGVPLHVLRDLLERNVHDIEDDDDDEEPTSTKKLTLRPYAARGL